MALGFGEHNGYLKGVVTDVIHDPARGTPLAVTLDFNERNGYLKGGSLIEMTGPKRAIEMVSSILVEFDMRIKNGEQEEDDLQLIDGAIACHNWRPQ
nr:unnamed protein product [Digitaria exilis]